MSGLVRSGTTGPEKPRHRRDGLCRRREPGAISRSARASDFMLDAVAAGLDEGGWWW